MCVNYLPCAQVPAELITVDPHQLTALDDADMETLEKEKLEAEVVNRLGVHGYSR